MVKGEFDAAAADFSTSINLRTSGKIYPALMRWLTLSFAGSNPDRAGFAIFLDSEEEPDWLKAVGAYYLGETTVEDVITVVQNPEAACEANFYLGAFEMLQNNPEQACHYFEQAIKSDVHLYMEYTLSGIFLERLKNKEKELPERKVEK